MFCVYLKNVYAIVVGLSVLYMSVRFGWFVAFSFQFLSYILSRGSIHYCERDIEVFNPILEVSVSLSSSVNSCFIYFNGLSLVCKCL